MEDLVGKILDNTYQVDKLLGQGGMGAVFKGRDISLDRDVAIKLMHPHISRQPGFRDRFLQEARAIASLEHTGIVRIHAFSRNPELLYIVMAFVPGRNLRDWLHLLSQKNMLVSLPESLAIVELVAEALAYAHRRGVTHRDIKPGNILLRPLEDGQRSQVGLSFQPIVTDFGLAKLAEGGVRSVTGMSMGTPAYMAPEQCEGLSIDGRADIYALGIVLYELVTGRVPFPVKTLTEAIRSHTKEAPAPPRTLVPDLPSQVEEIILAALAKAPAQRYQTASEMARAMRVARQALPQEDATLAATQRGHVSLVTMMGEEPPPPAPESEAWPTPPSEIPAGGRVVILDPEGDKRSVPIGNRKRLTVGRGADNDIVLSDDKASRHHAQITFDGTRALLTDLNSTNGTFLGNNRLLPGVPEQWESGRTVRIGDHWLRLEMARPISPEPSRARSFAAPSPPPSEQPIHVALDADRVSVQPGQSADIVLRILNRQQQVDHFIPLIEGIPGEWVTRPEGTLRLAPGDTGTVSLRLHPPQAPTSGAGEHPFVVKVVSRANPSRGAETGGTLNIEPFRDLQLGLTPNTFVNSGQGRVRITNRGNVPENGSLSASDPSGALKVVPGHPQFALQAGQEGETPLSISTKRRRPLMGTPQTHPFSLKATTPQGKVVVAQGSLTVKPYLPTWAIPLLSTLALLLCALGVFAYSNVQKTKAVRATEQAVLVVNRTATAAALGQEAATSAAKALHTRQASVYAQQTGTAEAMTLAEAQTATASVATATAEWLAADSDGDGLINSEELRWGTDPNNRDSDGDTLLDGQEVSMGISPISKDTDGDGTQDNVDPDPGQLPTLTPLPTLTATETQIPTSTPTVKPSATPVPTPDHFQQNQTDTFTFSAAPLGELNKVCLRQDNSGSSPDWYVSWIEVDTGSGYFRYTFNRWIAKGKGDGNLWACQAKPTPTPTTLKIKVTLVYKIKTPIIPGKIIKVTPIGIVPKTPQKQTIKLRVQTGNVSGGGTSAKVSVRLYGSAGDTGWRTLN